MMMREDEEEGGEEANPHAHRHLCAPAACSWSRSSPSC